MEVLNNKILDELEALIIIKDVFFKYIPDDVVTAALAEVAERIKDEIGEYENTN